MNNDSIYSWIISHPKTTQGNTRIHNRGPMRQQSHQTPKSQFHLFIRALGQYIKENVLGGRGVNYRNFEAFAFQIETQIVKPAQHSNFDITKDLSNQREQRMLNHKIRASFVPDIKFRDLLIRYPVKQEITKPKSQHSVYQKGFNMIFCNPVPIAASGELDKDVTESILLAFARAVGDLENPWTL